MKTVILTILSFFIICGNCVFADTESEKPHMDLESISDIVLTTPQAGVTAKRATSINVLVGSGNYPLVDNANISNPNFVGKRDGLKQISTKNPTRKK